MGDRILEILAPLCEKFLVNRLKGETRPLFRLIHNELVEKAELLHGLGACAWRASAVALLLQSGRLQGVLDALAGIVADDCEEHVFLFGLGAMLGLLGGELLLVVIEHLMLGFFHFNLDRVRVYIDNLC